MLHSPSCPICRHRDWQELGRRRYTADVSSSNGDAYLAKRLQVLFQLWFAGMPDVELTSGLCRSCGFITNVPRVEERDVDAKYRLLEELGQDYGSTESPQIEQTRSQRLLKQLRGFLPNHATILDFGGGDGRLMAEFSKLGHACYLVDYNQSPRDGVIKLADTLEQDFSGLKFDVIVCNHVMEHVADPVNTLRSLGARLKDKGCILVEVPMEIWKKPPLFSDPVTHVNFFTTGSLARAMEEAGLRVAHRKLTGYLHPSGKTMPAVLAIGTHTPASTSPVLRSNGYSEALHYLNPTWIDRLKRKWQIG